MNLISPALVGPAQAYDTVARHAPIDRSELVGLVPDHVLATTPQRRWAQLDLNESRSVGWRMQRSLAERGIVVLR